MVESGRKVAGVSAEFEVSRQTTYIWRQQVRVDASLEAGAPSSDQAELAVAKRRTRELEHGEPRTSPCEQDSAEGVRVFRTGGARPPTDVMAAFNDEHREVCGFEPICRVLRSALSTY